MGASSGKERQKIQGDTQRREEGANWQRQGKKRGEKRQKQKKTLSSSSDLAYERKLRAERIVYGNAYHKALQVGEAKSTSISVMIVGRDRSGKTSLKKHLLGIPYDSEQPSTSGIEVDVVDITDENAKDAWKRENVEHLTMTTREAKKILMKQVAQVLDRQKEQRGREEEEEKDTEEEDEEEEEKEREEVKEEEDHQQHIQQLELSVDEIDNIKSFQQRLPNENNTPSAIRMFLHDFAGQDIFYDTHFYFLRLMSVYIVVHDLTSPLEDVAHPRFKPSRMNGERNLKNPLLATNLQRFLSWLTVLERIKDTAAEAILEDLEDCKVPPALIALTNSDRFNGNTEDVMQMIRDILTKKGYSNVFIDFYVMDNTSSGKGKDQVRELRGKVYELCKKMLDKQRPFPVRWFQFEAALTKKMVKEKMNFISVEEAYEIAKTCNVEDIEAAIAFLHHKGVVVHHPGSSVVVLNPPWLMNILTTVISVPQENIPKEGPYRKLITEGILMQDYLKGKEHGDILKEFLLQFGLICPWEHAEGPAFIVPSVAPLMQEGEGLEEKLSTSPVASVFFIFKLGYILPGLFTKFVVRMINECREFLRIQQPGLFCNYTLLSFMYGDSKIDVYIIKQLDKIKVCVVPNDSVSPRCCNAFISYLKEVMVNSMQTIKDDEELFYLNVDIRLAVKCSECSGAHNPCLDHGDVNCKHDGCGHFWFLEKLQECSEDLVCRYGSKLETREFSLELVKPWIFTEEVSNSAIESPTVESLPQEVTVKEEVSNSAVESKAIEYLSQKLAAKVDGVSLSSPDSEVTESSFHDVPISDKDYDCERETEETMPGAGPVLPSVDLQPHEIAMIAKRIPRNWYEVALLTKLFEVYEVDDILYSRCGEDASFKALTMLKRYVERKGSRETLASALDMSDKKLAQEVRSGHYIHGEH